jgi:dephospho-CoA kinase
MLVVGVTGSIAMGKTEVSKHLRTRGYPVFDSDSEVHALYASKEGVELLKPHVPEAIIAGQVNRNALSRIVLSDSNKLTALETLVHAEVAKRKKAFLAAAEQQGHALAFVDVPLLFETGADKHVDAIIVVSAPAQVQHERALSRPGMTEERLKLLLARQWPDSEKRKHADIVIENKGTLGSLYDAVDDAVKTLREGQNNDA